MNQTPQKFFAGSKTRLAAIAAPAVLLAGEALAAVPTEVTTALGDAKADGVAVATLCLVAVVAIFAFTLMRKGLR